MPRFNEKRPHKRCKMPADRSNHRIDMPKIFLSYRREDSEDIAGRLHDRLSAHFGDDSVFIDIDSIPLGIDFRKFLSNWVAQCDVLLAVVGDGWLEAKNPDGSDRLGDPADFVTVEIQAALQRDIPVIPLLVGRAVMPKSDQLPGSLADLAFRNAAEVRSGRDFHSHVTRLIEALEHQFQSAPAKSEEKPPAKPEPPPAETPPETKRVAEDDRPHELSPEQSAETITRPEVPKPTNLGFEHVALDGSPRGWFDGNGFVAHVSTDYKIQVVNRADLGLHKCAQLFSYQSGPREFGTLMQRCPASHLVGHRVRIEADLATETLDGRAALWLRIDDPMVTLYFNNMHDRPIRGDTMWTNYALEAEVPAGSTRLNYGILLVANGTVWVDNFKVLVKTGGQWRSV